MRSGDVREVHVAGQDLLDDRQVKADLMQGPDQLETSQRLASERPWSCWRGLAAVGGLCFERVLMAQGL